MIQLSNSGGFSTGAKPVVSTGAYDLIETIQIPEQYRGKAGSLLVHGDVGAGGALNGFQLTWAAVPGGTHTTLVTDAGLNTATQVLPATTNNIYQTAAGGTFKILFGKLPAEIGFYAKAAAAATTVSLSGGLS